MDAFFIGLNVFGKKINIKDWEGKELIKLI
jgi:hypothetical protein